MRASAAWTLPTCLCSRPDRARMNTSKSGHSLATALISRCLRGTLLTLLGVRDRRFAHPFTFIPRTTARFQPFPIARTVALEHVVELAPVDGTEVVVLGCLV